ncbi:MAG: hypothetical protein ACRC5R_01430 [Mycoplasmatales bacterium]
MDNYEACKECDYTLLEKSGKIMRDGASLGITTIITALNLGNLKYNLQALIMQRVQLCTMEKSDVIQLYHLVEKLMKKRENRWT